MSSSLPFLRTLRSCSPGAMAWTLTVMAVFIAWPCAAAAPPRLTFTKDVAPIVWSRCASCHRPGEIGPFSLISYADVKQRAAQIKLVTSRRLMPPWKPEPGKGEFQNDRRLTDAELDILQRWIAEGAPEGDRSALPPMPTWGSGWRLGPPDLVVTMAEAYRVRGDGGDVFRTFVIPIPTSRPRYVRALEFHPGNPRVVHHANLGVDRTRSSHQLDLRDPEPGYEGSMERDARYPEGQLLGWTPGQAPHEAPAGTQWRLEAGSDLVVQLHLKPTGKPESVKVSVGLYFTDEAPSRTPIGLRLGSETIDIPAGDPAYVVSDRYTLPVDVDVLAVQPHAHDLGRRMEAQAALPDGSVRWLISIPDWDFGWQDVYRYVTPIPLPKGTTISMRYVYDNSAANIRNPHHPPARVVWGQNTTDEMGDLWIQLIPRVSADLTVLNDDFRRKANAEDLAAYSKLLKDDPNNPLRHDAVAGLYLEDGRLDEAMAEYRESLRLNPDSAPTHYNFGFALSASGRRAEAIGQFEQAVRIDPDYAQAHNNLGALLQLEGKNDLALSHYERAVALRSDNFEAQVNLAQILSALGRWPEAIQHFRRTLALKPDHAQAEAGLAWILATAPDEELRRVDEAVALAERAADATLHQELRALDALAAAYASAGRYDAAATIARSALEIAVAAGQLPVAAQFRQRIELYQSGRPLRMPRP
ncbi:MAG TPA: tetratricopeptide repeat protein [Vicinamibacterales bacterium]